MASTRTRTSSITVTRRGLLRLGVCSLASFGLPQIQANESKSDFRCIFLNLVGGPSHLDTWDPKPEAPVEYRGPFRAIRTRTPGMIISELFPRMASITDKFSLVRSVYHDEAPIHETGQQLIQTAQLGNAEHAGNRFCRSAGTLLIPGTIENTGVQLSHGQECMRIVSHRIASNLDREAAKLREAYGDHAFGRSCLLARQAIEQGERCVTVNMFRTVYDCLSWDCHADGASLNTQLADYRNTVAPMFDASYTTLLLDLEDRGLLKNTLVVAAGEFGRSPKINLRGGRDHWTGAWTAIFAGGSVRGGQVIGSTDHLGRMPISRPVHASAIANTILFAAGHQPHVHYRNGEPIMELFARQRHLA